MAYTQTSNMKLSLRRVGFVSFGALKSFYLDIFAHKSVFHKKDISNNLGLIPENHGR